MFFSMVSFPQIGYSIHNPFVLLHTQKIYFEPETYHTLQPGKKTDSAAYLKNSSFNLCCYQQVSTESGQLKERRGVFQSKEHNCTYI